MVAAVSQLMTLEEFWEWYPDGYGRYELRNGVPIEMRPTPNTWTSRRVFSR